MLLAAASCRGCAEYRIEVGAVEGVGGGAVRGGLSAAEGSATEGSAVAWLRRCPQGGVHGARAVAAGEGLLGRCGEEEGLLDALPQTKLAGD